MQRWLNLVGLILLLGSGCSFAAEPATADSSEQTAQETDADTSVNGEEEPAETAENTRPATAAGNIDFVPTVQISEDLSVSFPTDI